METSRSGLVNILVISRSEPRLYIFPNSKKERVSFTAYDMINEKEISVIATKNVKFYLKRFLQPSELWRLEGVFNMDNSTLYLDRAFKVFNAKESKEIAVMILNYWKKEGKIPEMRE